ncbi:hypothetical protein Pfo_012241 [Paulownia fortunei]|nr:hypothetical protein Pfo_012241 [Paulownia fortunei]
MAQELVEWWDCRWKAMNFAALEQSSISFFHIEKRRMFCHVGKGLSKDNKALLLVVKHWLEATDPHHRYGENLQLYYNVWFNSHSSEPFFYWLDIGDGKQLDLKDCPRTELLRQCVRYLGPKEREAYEVIVESGKFVYRQNGAFVHTTEGMKWICKERGLFQHSSFLAGAAIVAAGRLVVSNGIIKAIWAYSGHYRPTEENFMELTRFLDEQQVDLRNVKLGKTLNRVVEASIQNPRNNKVRELEGYYYPLQLSTSLFLSMFQISKLQSAPRYQITNLNKVPGIPIVLYMSPSCFWYTLLLFCLHTAEFQDFRSAFLTEKQKE